MPQQILINNHPLGSRCPTYIIAEAGVNHNGDINLAFQLIQEAAKSGVDAVKFQSFITEELITPFAEKADYQIETTGSDSNQYGMLKSLKLNPSQHALLMERCNELGITYICTPYEKMSVDMLDEMNIPAFKVASTDTTNIPLLRHIARKKRPVILSTGMSSLGEVELALDALYSEGLKDQIALLHCTSEYPAPIEEVNLNAILTMKKAFDCPVGFSDHTPGIDVSPWAVVMGADIIEKHFTLDRTLPGPDHRASLESKELYALVQKIRLVEAALGDGIKRLMPSETSNKPRMQKSLVSRRTIKAGKIITPEDLTCKRPGTGLSPSWHDQVVGKARSDRNSLKYNFNDGKY